MEKHGHRVDMSSLSGDEGAPASSKAGPGGGARNGPKVALVIGLFGAAGAIYYFNPFAERASHTSTTGMTMGGGTTEGAGTQPGTMSAGGEGTEGGDGQTPLPRGGSTHPRAPDPDAEDPGDEPDPNPPAPPGGGER